MKLNDLVGLHSLNGVEIGTRQKEDGFDNCMAVMFSLDGVVYTAIEDPSDGYRSCLDEIFVGGTITNMFPGQQVFCYMAESRNWEKDDILEIRDVLTSLIVLAVGTRDMNDYYPSFVCEYYPENMAINKDIKKEQPDNE